MEQWIDNNGLNNKTGLPSNNWTRVFELQMMVTGQVVIQNVVVQITL
jgi:hypothetical protein